MKRVTWRFHSCSALLRAGARVAQHPWPSRAREQAMAANGAVKHASTALILDYGSQYTQLICRRVRELGVYSVMLPGDVTQVRAVAAPAGGGKNPRGDCLPAGGGARARAGG